MSEAAAQPEPTPFQKFYDLAKQVVSVPKKEIERREKVWRADRKAAKAKRQQAR